MSTHVHRKLTTIMAADAAGYSRRMGEDEVATLTALHDARRIIDSLITRHEGRIANTAGDGLIAEFPSVVEAVTCAVEIQRELGAQAAADPKALQFRIGLHLGDVIVDGDDLLGEGVNLAARLETMAEPGGILLSRQVYDHVHSKLTVGFEFVGDRRPRNFVEDVAIYRIAAPGRAEPAPAAAAHRTAERLASALHARPMPEADKAPEVSPGEPRMLIAAAGALLAALLAIDLMNGLPFFVHWVALPVLTLLGLRLAPTMARSPDRVQPLRGLILIAALTLLNLFTWNGTFWAIWPIAALVAIRGVGLLRSSRG